MWKSSILACAVAAMAASGALAQTATMAVRHQTSAQDTGTITANGRCNGVSYGTGARRCDTASGGPSGGLSSRN